LAGTVAETKNETMKNIKERLDDGLHPKHFAAGDCYQTSPVLAYVAKSLQEKGLSFFFRYPLEGLKTSGIYRPDFLIFDGHGRFVLWVFHELTDQETDADSIDPEAREWLTYNGFEEGKSVLFTGFKPAEIPIEEINAIVMRIEHDFKHLVVH